MTERETASINAGKKDEYLGIISRAFDNWHKTEWYFMQREEFDKTSAYSFLAYLRILVGMADETGQINVENAGMQLREQMGEYFREEKLKTALWFLKEGDWEQIK